jgi:hypothetical protein
VRDDSIGTLWLLYRDDKSAEGAVIRQLVAMLVQERAAYERAAAAASDSARRFEQAYTTACRDYGLDPITFPTEAL